MLTQKTRHALRSLLYIGCREREQPVQLAAIALAQNIPAKYLEHIMIQLRNAGLVHSSRGPKGGYTLARNPESISFADVVQATEGAWALLRIPEPDAAGAEAITYVVEAVSNTLCEEVAATLGAISLADANSALGDGAALTRSKIAARRDNL